jgi:beta-glucosidase
MVEFDPFADFDTVVDAQGAPLIADVGILVLAEPPYAEGPGDRADLTLEDGALTARMKERTRKLIVIVMSGRPVIVTEPLSQWDALVAAWLPGTEGQAVADMLFGDYDFTGKLPYTWPRSNEQLPFDFESLPTEGCEAPLFPFGYGLTLKDASPVASECPGP